jgi:DNA-binding transcriptional regulator YiaG
VLHSVTSLLYAGGMKALKKAIKLFGSREALAVELGVSAQTIWRWEKDPTKPMPIPEQRLLKRIIQEKTRVSR